MRFADRTIVQASRRGKVKSIAILNVSAGAKVPWAFFAFRRLAPESITRAAMIGEGSRVRWLALLGISVAVAVGGVYVLFSGVIPRRSASLQTGLLAAVPRSQAAKGNGRYWVTARPVSAAIDLGSLHEWLITIEAPAGGPARGCRVAFDAWMPEHGHGLPTSPEVTGEGPPGTYVVEGVRFSMRGRWELNLTVAGCGPAETISVDIQI